MAKRNIIDAMSYYRQLLSECSRKRQTTLDEIFTHKKNLHQKRLQTKNAE